MGLSLPVGISNFSLTHLPRCGESTSHLRRHVSHWFLANTLYGLCNLFIIRRWATLIPITFVAPSVCFQIFVHLSTRLTPCLGEFAGVIHQPSKYAARIAQAFTATDPSVRITRDQWEEVDDLGTRPYYFTDGVGTISQLLG